MSVWVPPSNAVELWGFAERFASDHTRAIAILDSFAYEYVGGWASNGGEYYAPIAGRLPVDTAEGSEKSILIQSPTSFNVFRIKPGDNPADLRAFLDEESAYLPAGGKE